SHLRLADPDAHTLDGESLDDRVSHGRGERLEQREAPAVGDLLDAAHDLPVVDRVLDPVGQRRIGDLEPDVEEEGLATLLLSLGRAVAAVELEPGDLDDDHPETTAAATVSASTCSR